MRTNSHHIAYKTSASFGSPLVGRTYQAESLGGYRYSFNGKEKNDEVNVDGGCFDFGSRILDARLGRWLSLDPLQAKYPNLSPFNYCANKPILCIDPDGKIVKLYNSEGTLVATISNGKTVIEKGQESDPILKSYNIAKAYIGTNSTMFTEVENDNNILEIQRAESPKGGGNFKPAVYEFQDLNGDKKCQDNESGSAKALGNGKIQWDIDQGFVDAQGNKHSPALVLFHELSHAKRFMKHLSQFIKNNNDNDPVKWGRMENAEENDAVKETNEVSKKLNNGDGGNGTRLDHGFKKFFKSVGVSSLLELVYEKFETAKDKTRVAKKP